MLIVCWRDGEIRGILRERAKILLLNDEEVILNGKK
jgi:hypothetical protein